MVCYSFARTEQGEENFTANFLEPVDSTHYTPMYILIRNP